MSFFQKRATLLQEADGAGHLQFQKAPHSTGEGDRYEEATLALVFLRSVRARLRFALSSNDAAGGKFDDAVLWWGDQQSPGGSALLVQLKHKMSARQTTVRRASLMVRKDSKKESKDFSVEVYHESHEKIRDSLEGGNYTLVLSTNLGLDTEAQNMFVPHDPKSIPGLELLDSGGRLYRLNTDDEDVKSLVRDDDRFMQHFYLFCNQSSNKSMREKIYTELKLTLGVDESCCKTMCDDLCGHLREWMNSQNVCLTSSWGSWLNIVDTYIKDKVTTCNTVVTRIKYRNVEETLQAYIEGSNPAWIRPPADEATALTATKVHQMICDEKHIMVSVTRLSELEEKILCCWGPFCPWLVIVDDNDGDKHSYDILDHLRELARPNRHLVIVSDKGDETFPDMCQSDDILVESWEELLKVKILLNSDKYVCHLGDLCNTESLKPILDQNPKALAALSQLSDPVRMGQDLDPLPKNHICRQLTSHMRLSPDFFSSIEEKKVCIMNELSYEILTNKVVMRNTVKFEELEKYLRVSDPVFPLFVVTRNIDCSAVQMISSKYADVRVYVLQHVDDEWLYVEEQSISLLNVVHSSNNRVIVEGRPGVGKSTMLLDMAQQLKGQHPSWWILRIDLLKYSEVFDSSDSGVKAGKDILARVVYNEKNLAVLECALLQYCLQEYPRIVCLVDGFDEVCPDFADKCLEALQKWTPQRGKLVVATRPSVTGSLEAALGVLSHSLPAFSEDQLNEFHRKSHSEIAVTDMVRDLLKIPLFSKMYAEVLESKDTVDDSVSLYETFFGRKFERLYKEKLEDDLSKPANKKMFRRERMQHEKHLAFLAVSHLLPALEVPGIAQLTSEDRDDLVKAGVIYRFISDKPVFIHRTFAEHFLAKWCFSDDADTWRADVYRKALSDASLEFFIESFDRMASKERPLLTAVLNHRETEVKSLLEKGANPTEGDKWGRSSLHLAAAYSRDTTLLGLLVERLGVTRGPAPGPAEVRLGAGEAVSETDRKPRNTESAGVASDSQLMEARERAGPSAVEEMVGTDGPPLYEEVFHAVTAALGAEDGLLRWTPLRYAAKRRRWRAVTALLEVGAQLRHLGDFQRGLHDPEELWRVFKEKGYRALFDHIASKDKSGWSSQMLEHRGENQKCLEIKVGVSIVCADLSAAQYLEISDELGASANIEVAKLVHRKMRDMLEKSSGVPTSALEQHQDCSGTSQLGESRNMPPGAAGLGSSLVQQMEMAGDGVMFRDANGETLLHYAVRRDDVKCLRQLIGAGSDVNVRNNNGESPIHFAALVGKVDCLKVLLSAGAAINIKAQTGRTPLHHAAWFGSAHCVKLLLDAGADTLAQDSEGQTALHRAAVSGNSECVRLLADATRNLELTDPRHLTALHYAAESGDDESLKYLLRAGAYCNPVSDILDTPLHMAAHRGSAECVRLLVQEGAQVAARNDRGITALHWATSSGSLACVRILLEAGPDIRVRDGKGDTPLHWAARKGSPDCLRLLLEKGADVNARNHDGVTPLHYTAVKGHAECAKLLLDADADPLALDSEHRSPLYMAAYSSNAECVRLLLQAGADVAVRDAGGTTALHCAAYSGDPDCVRELLQAGADVREKDEKGQTPLHWAVMGGSAASLRLLLEKGADVNEGNNTGATPLHYAAVSGDAECVKLLLDAAADPLTRDFLRRTPLHLAARRRNLACFVLLLYSAWVRQQTSQ